MDVNRVLPSRVAYPRTGHAYPHIARGEGPYLYGRSGQRYIDAACGSGAQILGHGDKRVVAALADQTSKLSTFPSRYLGVEVVERFMDRLVAFAPRGIAHGITYSSGSDAVEAAIKLAVQYQRGVGRPEKTKIVGRRGSYHGSTLAGLEVGGFVRRRRPFERLLANSAKAASAHCPRCEFELAPHACGLECVASVEAAFVREGPQNVAAFILEPIVGAALSAAIPDPRYMSKVRELCARHDVLLIADEVMTGFGRTATPFAVNHWQIVPDIIVCGKAISAGYYPMSAILVAEEIGAWLVDTHEHFQNGHTHACSPVAAAVGLEVLDRLEQTDLMANAAATGAYLADRMRARLPGSLFRCIRGKGLMIGFDLESPVAGRALDPGELSDRLQRAALRHGLIIYGSSGGALSEAGDHALLLPPLGIDEQLADAIVDALALAADDLLNESEEIARAQ